MTEITIQTETTETRVDVFGWAHKAVQLGLGAAAMAQKEVVGLFSRTQKQVGELVDKAQTNTTELVDKMVARGADVEKSGRERLNTALENRKKQVDDTVAEAQDSLDGRIEAVLHSMNVPTKGDIESLNHKIAELTKKVNSLSVQ
jgi:poly(hydroxyalkanoate) granule-associated protein